jgi:hypothetical protein
MKIKSAFIGSAIALIAFAGPVHAADDQNPANTGTNQPAPHNPEDRGGNHERGEFEHRVGESNEGFQLVQFVLIGGALVVAVLLAYNAGKRNRKKNSQE